MPMSVSGHVLMRLGALFGRPVSLLALAEHQTAAGGAWRAFPLFARAAKAGLPEAQRRVGECYLMGQGVPANLAHALRWLMRAAEAGDTPAQTQLASLALQGARAAPGDTGLGGLFPPEPDLAPDFAAAELWSRRAAAAGSPEAQALLGLVLTAGPDGQRDHDAGCAAYRAAAAGGSSRGQFGLAMALLCDGRPGSTQEAQALLHRLSAERMPAAQFLAGVLAESGAAGAPDLSAAAGCYRAAAEQGHATAQFRLGLALLAGRGVPTDAFAGETWLRRAAMAGAAQAAAAIGDLYALPGGDRPACPDEAAAWYQRAADAGHAGAARQLGRAYLQGNGVPKDAMLAAHWLRAAIAGGEEMARVDMAPLSLARRSSEADQQETAAWFRRLAEAGNLAAWHNLGLCLAEGIGVVRDPDAAQDCFRKAAVAVPAARDRLAAVPAARDRLAAVPAARDRLAAMPAAPDQPTAVPVVHNGPAPEHGTPGRPAGVPDRAVQTLAATAS